jgi:hypothetical protein
VRARWEEQQEAEQAAPLAHQRQRDATPLDRLITRRSWGTCELRVGGTRDRLNPRAKL